MIMNFVKGMSKKLRVAFLTCICVLGMAVPALAEPTAIDVSSVFDTTTSQVSTSITSVLPYAAVILAAILSIRIGMKVYKTVCKG